MGKKFRMGGLVERYARGCGAVELLAEVGGRYDGLGEWLPGEAARRVLPAAIAPYTEQQLLQSGGALSRKDRKLYSREDLGEKLTELKICAEGELYTVTGARGTGRYADVWVYSLTWAGHPAQSAESGEEKGAATENDAGKPAGGA